MRSFILAVTLLTATLIHAAPTFEFTTEHTRIAPGQGASVFVHNTSEERAFDVTVTLRFSERLAFYNGFHGLGEDWQCTESGQTATCRTPVFDAGRFDGLFFTFMALDSSGGHVSAVATLTAHNLPQVGPIVFDVVMGHSLNVTTSDDFGDGSLRAAIEEINANPLCGTDVSCSIGFAREMTITPVAPLPPIRKCNVSLFGPDDLEFPYTVKRVTISGERASYGNGLEVRASCAPGISGVGISSLVVHSWPWNGIYFEAPEPHQERFGHQINRVYVGTDATGLLARPNGLRGITTDSPHEIVSIFSSIVSGNVRSGVAFWRGKRGTINSTKLGVNREGNPLGNGAAGFFSFGVPFQMYNCTVAHNQTGVSIAKGTPEAAVAFSKIYWNEGLPIDWGLDGPTPNDDESDGIPNAPRILDAFYNEASNTVTVRGVVYLRAGTFTGRFGLDVYVARNERGDIEQRIPITPQPVTPVIGGGDVPFEFTFSHISNLRGQLIALQTQALADNGLVAVSSEISQAERVR